ncbi:MAG: helix-turn-helix transcriptional regulator [Christensenellales bacterium]
MDKKALKNYLRNLVLSKRADCGLTQEGMAERLKIASRSYSDIEHGKNMFSLTTCFRFAAEFDVDLNAVVRDVKDFL